MTAAHAFGRLVSMAMAADRALTWSAAWDATAARNPALHARVLAELLLNAGTGGQTGGGRA